MALLSIAVKIKQVGAEGEGGAIEVDCDGRGPGQDALTTAGETPALPSSLLDGNPQSFHFAVKVASFQTEDLRGAADIAMIVI